ncbi:MAG: flagellar protein [Epsilonproteobacteria bacterium]|nr:flagellar protein [Campylobacterota bacterium]
MYRWIVFALTPLTLFSLDISIDTAKDQFVQYSTLHIQESSPFRCEALYDDFHETKQVVCAFDKKPSKEIKNLQNDFFTIDTFIKKGLFFLSVKPKYKMKLFANVFDLTKDEAVFSAKIFRSDQWFVIGYKEKMPMIKTETRSQIALNFPVYLTKDQLPYVGSLDIEGKPVFIKKVEDVSGYIKVKKYFQEKNYEKCLEITQEILEKYPNTLFKAELLYYQTKIYQHLKDYDNVAASAKVFLHDFSADENVAEVLSLIAYAYGKMGMYSDSDYFFDRLFSEHANSRFAKMGLVYKGELEEESGGTKKAEEHYKKALHATKDVDVAVVAAYHLANMKLDSQPKEAGAYLEKIIWAKPLFFKEDLFGSIKLAKNLAEHSQYKVASDIAAVLLAQLNPTYDEYEEVLALKGFYLAHTSKKKEALEVLNKYLKKFPDGDYLAKVEEAKDQLFFDIEDLNSSVKLAHFNKLIEEYKDEDIVQKALYEKAKVYNELGAYDKTLAMQGELEKLDQDLYGGVEDIIHNAAIGAMQKSLEVKNCENVLTISSENNVTLSDKWDDGIYKCAMKGGDFQLAKQMILKNMDHKDMKLKELWLYRYIKVNFAIGNYQDTLDAAKDLIAMIELDKNSQYKDVYRTLFDTYARLENQDGMIRSIAKIEEIFQDSYKDLGRFAKMVAVGSEKKDDTMIIKYGKKIYDVQQKTSSHAQSPYVEFSLYQAYMNKQEYEKALEVIRSLDNFTLKNEDRARQNYLLGSVYAKLWRDQEAQEAYDAAIKADPKSAWAKLAQSAKSL